MSDRPLIPDFGAKIDLLLKSDSFPITRSAQLAKELGIGEDYLSRLKSGARKIPDHTFEAICKIFGRRQ